MAHPAKQANLTKLFGDSIFKLTWQWKMDPLKMYFLLKMVIFQPAMVVYRSVPSRSEKQGVYPRVGRLPFPIGFR